MSVDLVPEWTIGDLRLTSYPFGVDADSTVDIGEPEMVVESVTSQLADGDIERVVRHGNRGYALEVYAMGSTLAELAEAEALLRSELRRTGLLLTHDPGDGFTPPSVYEVQTAQLTPQRQDDHESHLIRKFSVTLTCAPFARSLEPTTVSVLTPPGALVSAVVNNADSLTGWTASGTDTPLVTVPGGYIRASVTATHPGRTGVSLVLNFTAIDMTSTPYLSVEISGPAAGADGFAVLINGSWTTVTPTLSRAQSSGTTVHYLNTGSVSISGVRVSRSNGFPTTVTLNVHHVGRTNTLGQVNPRQNAAAIVVGGTERTPCSLKVIPGVAEPLGFAIVHTSPVDTTGYSPSLRQWRVSGNPVNPVVGSLSGSEEAVTTNPVVAQVPISSLPEDGYAVMAYMRSSVAGIFPITWQARTAVGGTYLGGHEGIANVHFPFADKWTLVPLAVVTLPPVRASMGGLVQLNISRTVVSEEIYLDEWWAFRVGDDCALTVVDDSNASFLWLDSPDSTSPVPRVWVSNNGDRSDQRHPGASMIAQGNHVLHPDGTSVFVAASGIESPVVSATYYQRWHSNAAE